MNRNKLIEPAIYVILIVALLLPRLSKIDSFVTLDEPYWLSMGANFYYALGQREFENTVYEYQPAVTTMWIVTAAMAAYFPEYRGLGQGYLEFEKGALDPFLIEHGKDPLVLLKYARLIQVFIIVLLFLALYHLLQCLLPRWAAIFAILFASFDPFFLGQSRLLNHEAMMSLFVMISVLALFIYLSQGRQILFLLASGVAAGLAQLTKSSAIAMLFPIGVAFLIQIVRERKAGLWGTIWRHTQVFGAWLVILVVTYLVFWPGMWVAPGKMLYEVYGNAFSYAFQGARLTVTEELQPSDFSLEEDPAGILNLIDVFLWRTSPFTWLGMILGCVFTPGRRRDLIDQRSWIPMVLCLSTAVAFILLIGIAQGRNSPHYILASYLSLNLVAGPGWLYFIKWLAARSTAYHVHLEYAGALIVFLGALWSALSFHPYYYTYRNPILYAAGLRREFPQKPYGEGLAQAAQYLAGLPGAKDRTALVYYARGCFSYFYPGETTRFKPYYADPGYEHELLTSVHSADYLVIYHAAQGQSDRYDKLLGVLSMVEPIHEIWLDGYKYAMIYEVSDLSQDVFKALGE